MLIQFRDLVSFIWEWFRQYYMRKMAILGQLGSFGVIWRPWLLKHLFPSMWSYSGDSVLSFLNHFLWFNQAIFNENGEKSSNMAILGHIVAPSRTYIKSKQWHNQGYIIMDHSHGLVKLFLIQIEKMAQKWQFWAISDICGSPRSPWQIKSHD